MHRPWRKRLLSQPSAPRSSGTASSRCSTCASRACITAATRSSPARRRSRRLEMMIDDLVPRRSAPIVVLDGGGEGLAEKAARAPGATGLRRRCGSRRRLRRVAGRGRRALQRRQRAVEGLRRVRRAPVRHAAHPARRAEAPAGAKSKLVILDSRPFEEYHRMNIPGGIDVPGAELAWRVHDLAPDPDTLVVVNCAGRTRSIIGCQSLRNAGIPNRVVALKDGTMGWDLAGFECERGATARSRRPPEQGRRRKRSRPRDGLPQRFGVKFATSADRARLAEAIGPHALPPRRAHAGGVRARPRRRLAPCAGRPAGAGERRVRRACATRASC